MTGSPRLAAGALDMERATIADREGVEALQREAYARNRTLLGVEPIPLLADYDVIFQTMEVWVTRSGGHVIDGALILEPRPEDLLIWSIATRPGTQATGLGAAMLKAAETRAGQLGLTMMRLYTGTRLQHLVSWYGRHGYGIERIEELADRSITHMSKRI